MVSTRIEDFLLRHEMESGRIELSRCTDEFLAAMREGLAGRPSSLLMIPTYIAGGSNLPADEPVIVMDAGGTNFRIAEVRFRSDGTPEITDFRKHPMPGTRGAITCDAFFDELAGYIAALGSRAERVGFCFSFPTEILPDRDGRILGFSKEVEVPDAGGRLIGRGINAALEARGESARRFTILNDTVAAMLCGLGSGPADTAIGFILGTGTNTCYLERTDEIAKIGGGTGTMAVNVESGCYSGLPRGDYDRALDEASRNPGDHLLEKMISGGYLGDLLSRTVRGAVEEGFFSAALTERFDRSGMWALAEFNAFLEGEGPLAALFRDPADRASLEAIVLNCFDRAARIITVNFAAILKKTGAGRDPARPVRIVAEGTAYERSPRLREMLLSYLTSYLGGTLGCRCEVVGAEDATLIGSAVAALLHP